MLTKVWTEQRKRFDKITSTDGVQTKKKAIKITAISNAIMTFIEKKKTSSRLTSKATIGKRLRNTVYNNKLNKIKALAKKNYFRAQFDMKINLKTIWKLIGMLVNKKSNSQVVIKKLICLIDKGSIAH